MLTIGIAGGTGSGKTTVVQKISEHFKRGEVVVVPQDSYYKDNSDIPLLEDRQKRTPITRTTATSPCWRTVRRSTSTIPTP